LAKASARQRSSVDTLIPTSRDQVDRRTLRRHQPRHYPIFIPLSVSSHYLERNQDMLVHYAARRRHGEPISTEFVESAVNQIVAKRMNKKQQMRWNRTTVQPFLDVRTAVLNEALEDAFRHRYPSFRSANDDQALSAAA
jgi:hypothetical protein